MSDLVRDFIAAETASLQRVATTPTASGYGIDLVCFDDLTPGLKETPTDSTDSLAQDLYHRQCTPRGSLPDDPDYGIDVLDLLHRGLTPDQLASLPLVVAAELRRDDRVSDVTVTASYDGTTLTLTELVTPADPELTPFTLLVSVADGATLLELQK